MKKILIIFGTRPEIIKLAPVIEKVQERTDVFELKICHTGQHNELAKQAIELFDLTVDIALDVMTDDQSLDSLTKKLLGSIGNVLDEFLPDLVIIQGDTTSAFVGALAAFYRRIKIAHVEAGLRTFEKYEPFPEELNRKMISSLADYHFAPTQQSKENLVKEGIRKECISVTGNTVVDSLIRIQKRGLADSDRLEKSISEKTGKEISLEEKYLLLTLHRRESLGKIMQDIFKSISDVCKALKIHLIYPLHPNPAIFKEAKEYFFGHEYVHTVPALRYHEMLGLMNKAYVIITDSGGIQEEGCSFKKPVVVVRNKTERMELLEANGGILVGTHPDKIYRTIEKLVRDENYYASKIVKENPFGKGDAGEKIRDFLLDVL